MSNDIIKSQLQGIKSIDELKSLLNGNADKMNSDEALKLQEAVQTQRRASVEKGEAHEIDFLEVRFDKRVGKKVYLNPKPYTTFGPNRTFEEFYPWQSSKAIEQNNLRLIKNLFTYGEELLALGCRKDVVESTREMLTAAHVSVTGSTVDEQAKALNDQAKRFAKYRAAQLAGKA